MGSMSDDAKETTINVAPNGGNGWGPYGVGWNGWGNGFGLFDNRAPATGVVGTVLGGVALLGLLAGGLGLIGRNGGPGANGGPGNECVTQRELSLVRENGTLVAENGQLKAQIYTDDKVDALRRELTATQTAQAVVNANVGGALAVLQTQAAQTAGMQMSVLKPGVIAASEAVAASFKASASGEAAAA